ncbi:hypothetical protein BYT27DRAFT_7160670 [Phlegmacium glaucopus]|nr:hypothetical protein BYT27DRAFT_7160670 [Phlegmacium glaucopus]
MVVELPAEILIQIFYLATDEDIIIQHGLPTIMAESAWYKGRDNWKLRSPQEAMEMLQRRSYAMKKAIVSTCKRWRDLGFECLFHCLYLRDPDKLNSLCAILDSSSSIATTINSSYGWWTRRIHISRFYITPFYTALNTARNSTNTAKDNFENALVSVIQHCPNLEIFVVEQPLKTAFGPVADALKTYASQWLRTVQWNVTGDTLSKVIWALDSLPHLISAHIDIETPVPIDQECARLGSATDLPLRLSHLQQLSLRGFMTEFLEQATGWDLPSLQSFAIDSGISQYDTPDVVAFLTSHGLNLVMLDLNLNVDPPVDVPTVLDICPALTTFTFNADWRINPLDTVSNITKRPHPHISTIGLHGLSYAFDIPVRGPVGAIASEDWSPLLTQIRRRHNDLNMAALNKVNFPKLRRIRALSQSMLNALNKSDGPSGENGGYDRWNRWSTTCLRSGIRLEDCTGQSLGTLPQDDEYEDEDGSGNEDESEDEDGDEDEGEDDDDDDNSDDDDSGEWESESEEEPEWGRRVSPLPEGNGRTMELTRLLEECRVMNEGRDEEMIARIRPMLPLDED